MAREFSRTARVAEQLQREIALIIQGELKDPRLGFLTIAGVEVSRDFSHAKVFFTTLGDDQLERERTQEVLNQSQGFMRHLLGRRLRIRSIPQLHFIYDESAEKGASLSSLIDEAVGEDRREVKAKDEECGE